MKIFFDQQIFQRQPRGGISRYFGDLANGLNADPSVSLSNRAQAQVVHATFYGGRPYRLRTDQRLVSSLFDLTPERHPEHFLLPQLRSPHANKQRWLAASDLILSISQASADDLCFFQPNINTNIQVIHLATQINCLQPLAVDQLRNKRFWLLVGKRHAYKNGLTLLRALKRIGPLENQPLLVCAGGGDGRSKEKEWIAKAGLNNQVLKIACNDQELAWLYRNAEAVLVPSIAEGFSLPLIEALVCDAPVIASDLEAHREVAGRYATLLPALNASAWADLLREASRAPLCKPSGTLGLLQHQDICTYYGLNRMIREHKEVYQALL